MAGPAPRPPAPLDAPRRALVRKHRRLAHNLAARFAARHPDRWPEWRATAALALCDAVARHDPATGVPLDTWIVLRVRGALRDRLRADRRFARPDVRGVRPAAALDPVPRWELVETVARLLRRLPPRHAAVCRLLYLDGLTQTEAARRLGLTQAAVFKRHREALGLLAAEPDIRTLLGAA